MNSKRFGYIIIIAVLSTFLVIGSATARTIVSYNTAYAAAVNASSSGSNYVEPSVTTNPTHISSSSSACSTSGIKIVNKNPFTPLRNTPSTITSSSPPITPGVKNDITNPPHCDRAGYPLCYELGQAVGSGQCLSGHRRNTAPADTSSGSSPAPIDNNSVPPIDNSGSKTGNNQLSLSHDGSTTTTIDNSQSSPSDNSISSTDNSGSSTGNSGSSSDNSGRSIGSGYSGGSSNSDGGGDHGGGHRGGSQ
ncbi:MAG: hypothetical protein JO297_10945 [Nitrososphaeraceae archaeon]|nr:hypothetical protein [Nitrososphaeraceae archaeon]